NREIVSMVHWRLEVPDYLHDVKPRCGTGIGAIDRHARSIANEVHTEIVVLPNGAGVVECVYIFLRRCRDVEGENTLRYLCEESRPCTTPHVEVRLRSVKRAKVRQIVVQRVAGT